MGVRRIGSVAAAALVGLSAATAAPVPKPAKSRPAILFSVTIPESERDAAVALPPESAWFLVNPDGSDRRPYRGKDGQTTIVALPNGPLVLQTHSTVDVQVKVPQTKAVTILLENLAEVKIPTDEPAVSAAAETAWKEFRAEAAADLARKAARRGATADDKEAAARAARDADEGPGVGVMNDFLLYPLESSPDRTKILFGDHRGKGFVEFYYDTRTKRVEWLHKLVKEPRGRDNPAEVVLSPDWTQLVYPVTVHPDDANRRRDELHVSDLDGTRPKRVGEKVGGRWTFPGVANPPAMWEWVGDGKRESAGLVEWVCNRFRVSLGTLSPDRRYSMMSTWVRTPDNKATKAECVYDSRTGRVARLPKGSDYTWVLVSTD